MNVKLRSIIICIATSLLMTACASLKQQSTLFSPTTAPISTTPIAASYAPAQRPAVILPGDRDLAKAQKHFHSQEYGLAEKHFRQASLDNPKNIDAWLGLAASYDELKRFDLANGTYRRAARLNKNSLPVLNNWGYSYLLRGNVVAARKKFLKAYEIDPANKSVNANLELLREGIRRNSSRRTKRT